MRVFIIDKIWIIRIRRESRREVIYKYSGAPNRRPTRQNPMSLISLIPCPKLKCHIKLYILSTNCDAQ
jgi:hypothetical protein